MLSPPLLVTRTWEIYKYVCVCVTRYASLVYGGMHADAETVSRDVSSWLTFHVGSQADIDRAALSFVTAAVGPTSARYPLHHPVAAVVFPTFLPPKSQSHTTSAKSRNSVPWSLKFHETLKNSIGEQTSKCARHMPLTLVVYLHGGLGDLSQHAGLIDQISPCPLLSKVWCPPWLNDKKSSAGFSFYAF